MKISLPGAKGNLFYAAFAANLASTAIGTHYSWSSPAIPKLEADDSWLPITTEEGSWIGSLNSLGTVFGPFLGGWMLNAFGRRWSIISSVVISTIAWVVLLFSTTVWEMYLGRFIGGVGGGIAFIACPTYVAEISEPSVRGALGSLFAFFLVGGYLVEYVLGPYITYWQLIMVNFIPAIVFLLAFTIVPESPYYLLRKDNTSEALDSLTWLRSSHTSEEIQKELNEIQSEVKKAMEQTPKLSDIVATRGNRMGLILSFAMVGGQQFSGVNVVLYYAQNIFTMAGTTISSSISTIIIGLILFVCGGLASPLARAFGMKNMFIFSAIGMAIFQFLLGIYFYFYSTGTDMTSFGWLPLVSMVFFIFTYTVGFGPLPWAVMAEVFPTNVKALASAFTASFCWFVSFLLTKFFSSIAAALGTYIPFFFFAICCILALIFTIFVLPDTRGMTLPEILDLLNKGPISHGTRKESMGA